MKINKKIIIFFSIFIILSTLVVIKTLQSSNEDDVIVNLKQGDKGRDIKINILKGEHYKHKLKVAPLININTPPQIAIWLEDEEGKYIETLYVTSKTVYQNWQKAFSDSTPKEKIERKESLPYWTHKKTDKKIDVDAITAPTPKKNFAIETKIESQEEKFVIFVEVNSSCDFNEHYSKDAKPGENHYSGGEWGSGQPAVVYNRVIDFNSEKKEYEPQLIGHSSPDGSNEELYKDLSKLTTAKSIVEKIIVNIE